MTPVSRRVQHTADTRAALLDAARDAFAERGYAEATIDEIAARAQVTKGAVYHHFATKRDLFRAVVEQLYSELVDQLAARAGDDYLDADLWDMVTAAYQARLDLVCTDQAFQRIVDQDASAVLGHEVLTEIAQSSANVILEVVLEEAITTGLIQPLPADTLAKLLGALIGAAAREIATAHDSQQARDQVGTTLDALLQGLRTRDSAEHQDRRTAEATSP